MPSALQHGTRLSELQGDLQALLRHLSAYRKLTD
jgi:hypothetical protein